MAYSAPPARTEISDTYPNPSNAVARVGFGKLWDYVTGLLGATGSPPAARTALGLAIGTDVQAYSGTLQSYATVSTLGFKNRIINGAAAVAQRGNVAAVNGVYVYGGADRIACSVNSLTSGTIQQLQSAAAGGVSGYCQAVQATTSAAGAVLFRTCLENLNTLDLNSSTVTIKCKVFQDTGSAVTVGLELHKPTSTANTFSSTTSLATTSVSVPSSVLTPITLTYTLGAAEASLGLAAIANFVLGSAVSGKYFTITDWQLEKGSTATSFDYRPYGTELALCQRYLPAATGNYCLQGQCANTTQAYLIYKFPVTARTAPTGISTSGGTGQTITNSSIGNVALSAIAFSSGETNSGMILCTVAGGLTAGNATTYNTNGGQLLFTGCEL